LRLSVSSYSGRGRRGFRTNTGKLPQKKEEAFALSKVLFSAIRGWGLQIESLKWREISIEEKSKQSEKEFTQLFSRGLSLLYVFKGYGGPS